MTDGDHPRIVVPHGNDSPMRYFVGLFLLAWLGGWFAGFSSAVSKLSSGQADAILVFWLVGWTLGGAFTVYLAYRAFRPSVPESLRLMPNGVTYDSGIPPLLHISRVTRFPPSGSAHSGSPPPFEGSSQNVKRR
jgi:hypothetical protein